MEPTASLTLTVAESDRAPQSRWSYWRFRIFTSAWVLYAAYYFCRKNFSVVMPMMARTGHFGNFDLAQLVFVFSLAYAVGQFVAGALGDRFGGRLTGAAGRSGFRRLHRRHGSRGQRPPCAAVITNW